MHHTTPSCATVYVANHLNHLHLAPREPGYGLSSHTLCLEKWTRRSSTPFNAKDDCQACRDKQELLAELPAQDDPDSIAVPAHSFPPSTVSLHGFCHDCAQGLLGPVHDGFELFILDGQPSHWFCKFCGSNHVTIRDEAGSVTFEQGDLYNEAQL